MELDDQREILDSLFDGVYMTDSDRRVTFWSLGAERISGYPAPEVVGLHCWDNVLKHVDAEGNSLCMGQCALSMTLADGRPREVEAYLSHRDGHRVPVRIRVLPLRGPGGEVTGAVEIFTDNFAPEEAAERIAQLERMAYLDALTNIANRRYAEVNLGLALNELERYGWPFGVILMDVDLFKEINDRLGHAVGDRVLKVVAATLEGSSRPSDVVARWGGDEFLAIVKNVWPDQLHQVAEKFCSLVESASIPLGEGPLRVTLSCGGALAGPGDTLEGVIERADRALYASKSAGRNCASL